MQLTDAAIKDAQVLWEYHRLNDAYGHADIILALGSYDLTVADFASRLFLEGLGKWLLFAGGLVPRTDLLQSPWERGEAEVFRDRALDMGVPEGEIIVETASMNTGENFRHSLEIIRREELDCKAILVVTKPNLERRARATALANIPQSIQVMVTSPPVTFREYCQTVNIEKLINLMVGDFQRIKLYPTLGFQAAELIPQDVDDSYRRLVDAGFTSHLI
jgi:uncharacterized SAM-binding protein YcdF (DUF218 family)